MPTSCKSDRHFFDATRKHWGIENGLYWCLDMNFDEDRCRTRVDNSGENLAVIRHISLNLYKAFTSVKLSMKAKRFRCSFDDDFLCSVIFNKLSWFFHAEVLNCWIWSLKKLWEYSIIIFVDVQDLKIKKKG